MSNCITDAALSVRVSSSPEPVKASMVERVPESADSVRFLGPSSRVAIYARYSTRFQHSTDDQIRSCREWANQNGLNGNDATVFADEAKTGKTHQRIGLKAMTAELQAGKFDVLVVFATSRLYRKMYLALRFIEEEITARQKRCVFVAQNIDTSRDGWQQLLPMAAMMDEWQLNSQTEFVRSSHKGLVMQELVWGTVTFGYCGQDIQGSQTKLGRRRRTWNIDEQTAPWVRRVFEWFTRERLSISGICRRLAAMSAPSSPKSSDGRWRRLGVTKLLQNRRYVGDFSYGVSKNIWQPKQGYSRQVPRDEPLLKFSRERLRIVDDATFAEAQRLLLQNRHFGGRPKRDSTDQESPPIIKHLLWCAVHEQFLVAASPTGLQCRHCAREPHLAHHMFSLVGREVATRMICEKLAELLLADTALVDAVREQVGHQAAQLQAPDPSVIQAMKRGMEEISRKIRFIYDAPAADDVDQQEQRIQLQALQSRRAALRLELEAQERASQQSIRIPSDKEVRDLLKKTRKLLLAAATDGGSKERAEVRLIIDLITGGKIVMSQAGEKKAKRGWLRGTFTVAIESLFTGTTAGVTPASGQTITLNFRDEPPLIALSEKVKALTDTGMMMAEIAKKLGIRRTRCSNAIGYWYRSRGLTAPDGRTRRSTLERKHTVAPTYQQIADEAAKLSQDKVPIHVIATRLNVDRNTVTSALKFWYRKAGQRLPPGKGRRKTLTSPPLLPLPETIRLPDQDDNHGQGTRQSA